MFWTNHFKMTLHFAKTSSSADEMNSTSSFIKVRSTYSLVFVVFFFVCLFVITFHQHPDSALQWTNLLLLDFTAEGIFGCIFSYLKGFFYNLWRANSSFSCLISFEIPRIFCCTAPTCQEGYGWQISWLPTQHKIFFCKEGTLVCNCQLSSH